VHDLVSEAIDGTLAPADSDRFHAHLTACPRCRALFGDVKECLTLLAEQPTLEAREGFDERVWARIRAERSPRADGWRARIARWGESLVADGAWTRWAPIGAAAALLAWVAVSPPGLPAGGAVAARDASAPPAAAGEVDVAAVAEEPADAEVDPDFEPVEYPAGMPEAIQLLLEASEAAEQDLVNPDRYRRSNWQYPIRPMHDPVSGPIIPVSGGTRVGAPSRPVSTEPGVPVLSF